MITIQAGYAVVVDDEPANRDFVERLLQSAGFKVTGAANGRECLAAAKAVPTLALALVDQQLPDYTGLALIKLLRADNPEALLVMATMHDDRNLIDEAFEAGVDVFLVKPHGFMELYRRLQEVDVNTSVLRQVIIDQYGPRPYRGRQRLTQATASVPAVTLPKATVPTATAPAPIAPVVTTPPVIPVTNASTPTPVPSAPAAKLPEAQLPEAPKIEPPDGISGPTKPTDKLP